MPQRRKTPAELWQRPCLQGNRPCRQTLKERWPRPQVQTQRVYGGKSLRVLLRYGPRYFLGKNEAL